MNETDWLGRQIKRGERTKWHHWWPKGMQRYWVNDGGKICVLNNSGELEEKKVEAKLNKIGARRQAYTLHKGDPHWQHKYEGFFESADNSVRDVLNRIKEDYLQDASGSGLVKRAKRHLALRRGGYVVDQVLRGDAEFRDKLFYLVASLAIRSPSFHKYRGDLNHYFTSMAWMEPGKLSSTYLYLFLLRSRKVEFIFGDGFPNTLFGRGDTSFPSGYCLVPILPELCLYISSGKSVFDGWNTFVIDVGEPVVDVVNECVQVYSASEVFFRNNPPKISQYFEGGEHLTYKLDRKWPFQEFDGLLQKLMDPFGRRELRDQGISLG